MAALAQGPTRLRGLLDADDTRVMRNALRQLGVLLDEHSPTDITVQGTGGFTAPQADLFLGNAGTALRPLTAALAVLGGHYTLRGVARMHERPVGDLVDALTALGLSITYTGQQGFPPLTITPGDVRINGPLTIRGDVSSQFLSALLLAAPLLVRRCGHPVQIDVTGPLISQPYIALTLALMARFGVQVEVETDGGLHYHIQDDEYQSPGELAVEGDASSASYFAALGVLGGGPIRLDGIGADSVQGDLQFMHWLSQSGARLEMAPDYLSISAPGVGRSSPESKGRCLPAFDQDFNAMPDAAMTAAMLALYADGPCRLRNIGSWRVKETDRIAAMQTELRKLGAQVQATADSLTIHPPERWQSASIATYDDHRMAMCFSLAVFGGVPVEIQHPGCVDKTFPEYFSVYRQLVNPGASSVNALSSTVSQTEFKG